MSETYLSSGAVIPTGSIDGVNCLFTLQQPPVPVTSLQLYHNGLLLSAGDRYNRSGTTPYVLTGSTITLKQPPQTGDSLVAYFTYEGTAQSTAGTYAVSPDPIDLTTVDAVKSWLNTSGVASKTNLIEDANLQRCITAASRYWLWRTGRGSANWQTSQHSPFNEAVLYDERYDGNGNDQLFLRNSPAVSILSLEINGRAAKDFLLSDAGNRLILRRDCFPRGRQNIRIQYTAGFVAQPVTGELHTIPTKPGPYLIQANSLPHLEDAGVAYFENGAPLDRVATAPQAGQYFLQAPGQYLFNEADAGRQILLSYTTAGTPADIRLAATQMAAVNYKRRQWIDQTSQAIANNAGTVTYRSWELPPEVVAVMDAYTRRSL